MAKKEHKTNGISSIMEDNGKSSDRSAKILEKRKERQFSKKTMKAEENHDVNQERLIEEDPKSNDGIIESGCTKRKKIFFKEAANVEEKHEISRMSPLEDRDQKVKIRKNKKNKRLLQKTNEPEEEREGHGECTQEELNLKSSDGEADVGINKWENVHLEEACMSAKVQVNMEGSTESKKPESDNRKSESNNSQKKQRLLEEAVKADQCGVCYLSQIPPHMDHVKLRQILSQYGEIQRIYLAPEGPATQVSHKRVKRKRDGGFQEQVFSEGWVEFTKKSLAKRVAHMLNGEQIGGRKRSSFYYDLWNIKYLSKFKWDDLTEEIAYKNAIREQKLALEISAAKRERDFYLSKVEKSRALSSIEERMKKKQKLQEELKSDSQVPVTQQSAKVIRQFQQKQPVADDIAQSKPRLSKDVLVGVFGNS